MMQGRLEAKGFEVVAVGSVNEALEQIVVQKFDVLLTDLQMPLPETVSQSSPPCVILSPTP